MRKILLIVLTTLAFTGLDATVGLHFNGEFLWWKADSENQYVNFSDNDITPQPDVLTQERSYYDYKWNPGYKIGVDYAFCMCERKLDLFAEWTYFKTSDSINLRETLLTGHQGTISTFTGLFTNSSTAGAVFSYDGRADLTYYRLDTGVSSDCFCVCGVSVSPSGAFTYAHIENASNESLSVSTSSQLSTLSVNSNFNGYGITAGATAHYSLFDGFYIYSKTDLSGLYGQYNISLNRLSISTQVLDFHQKIWRLRFIGDIQLGLEYYTCFFGSFPFSARIGWEFAYMPNMNVIGQVANLALPDHITINGLVAGLQLGF